MMDTGLLTELKPDESHLVGYWLDLGSGVEKDSVWERIEWLISSRLERISRNSSGTECLYRDPADGRYWEYTLRASRMRGGGPPSLKIISREQAEKKYDLPS
jgi:hypothetical protein